MGGKTIQTPHPDEVAEKDDEPKGDHPSAKVEATKKRDNVGQWRVRLHAASTDLERKWDRLLPLTTVTREEEEWPHGIIASGEDIMTVMAKVPHTPEVLVTDGGAVHASTSAALRARHLEMWGRTRHKATCVWMLIENTHEAEVCDDEKELACALDAAMQRRMKKACGAMGAQRFKWGSTEADFALDRIEAAMAVQEEEWGETLPTEALRGARFWEWPTEPSTEEEQWDGQKVSGLEVEEQLTEEEIRERAEDRKAWIAEGQTWWSAFLPAARERVRACLEENKRVNESVAEVVSGHSTPGQLGPKYEDALPGRVNDVMVPQDDYRPGARGTIWSWEIGKCEECVPRSVECEIREAGGFSAQRLIEIARILEFPDKRAVQMVAVTGASHATKDFPLNSHAGRNHQGPGAHHSIVTKMMAGKVRDKHFVVTAVPITHPFGVVPMGGTVQRQKELEAYEIERDGGDIDKNVRGTYNGSFPLDGTSPNDHCKPEEHTQKPWVSMRPVVRGAAIVRSIGAPAAKMFKLDLKAACTQLPHQVSQRWRQTIYWRWKVKGIWQGGFMVDKRVDWGMANSGNVFHRAVTCIMVRWVEKVLMEEWVPTMRCQITKKWMQERIECGHDGQQGVPGFVHGFLDEYWFFLAGDRYRRPRASAWNTSE
jgi:hypothetical protein